MVHSYKFLLAVLFSSFALTSETFTVNSGSYYYTPANLTISVGDMVEFVNDGGYHDVEVTSGPELLSLPPCSGPCTIGTLTFNLAGTYDYICSIGSHASNGMVGTITVEETNTTSTSVQVIHNSASPTVDVYIDGVLSVEGFAYRAATPVLDLGTDFTVGIAPAGGDIIASFPFSLEDGGEYVVVATGILNDDTAPFNLAATSTMFGATDGNVGLNVYHGSTDAPSVDVLADGSVLVSDLMYGEFSGFVEVAAADYTIGIAPTGGTSIADFTAPLSGLGGESAVVFASGFLTPGDSDPGFGLFAALEDGSVLELSSSELSVEILANPASFGLTSVYPNPFNPATSINYNVNKFSKVNINIYDVTGKLVSILENSYKPVGNHSTVWEASSLPSGVYFVNLSINSHTETIKIMLTK